MQGRPTLHSGARPLRDFHQNRLKLPPSKKRRAHPQVVTAAFSFADFREANFSGHFV
jgi:hypothetical protein